MNEDTRKRMAFDAQVYLRYKRAIRRSSQKKAQFHLGRFAGQWGMLSDVERQDWLVWVRSQPGKSEMQHLADAIQRWLR